jgi:DtxR family Mn-dependent transcriptional regulator
MHPRPSEEPYTQLVRLVYLLHMTATKSDRRIDLGCCGKSHTEIMEGYLNAIFTLANRSGAVTTSAVAGELGVAAPTVSAMLKRLEANDLIRRSDDHQIGLTEHGTRHALGVVRRHRLLEVFLAEVLSVPWDEVHAEAKVLEHGISARLEARIDAFLGHPTRDPHGDPIPPPSGQHVEDWASPLAAAPAGSRFLVERVSDRDSGALRHLAELGIRPGAVLAVLEWVPFGGPLWVDIDGRRHPLGSGLVQVLHGRTI